MADQVYFGSVFTNNDPDSHGLKPGDIVQLDTTLDNAVIKVVDDHSIKVLGVVITGGAKGSQVTICGFAGQRLFINVSGSATVNRGDLLVSNATIAGTCQVDNAAPHTQVFAIAIASKPGGVGNQVQAYYIPPSSTDTTVDGADPLGHYLVTQAANAPANAFNLATLTPGILQVSVSGSVATVSTIPSSSLQRAYPLEPVEDDSGSEVAQTQTQIGINLGDFGSTINLEIVGMGMSQSGTATFKVRMNGSDGGINGTTAITATATTSSFNVVHATGTFSNPGGYGRLIITVQSSAAGQDAQLRDITITLKS